MQPLRVKSLVTVVTVELIPIVALMAIISLMDMSLLAAAEQNRRILTRLTAVPFTDVRIDDAFWTPRLEINRRVSLQHNFQWCRQTGRIDNFAKAGGLTTGRHIGIYYNDSDVYKVLEGASYCLAAQPDKQLDATVDEIIDKISAAREKWPSGSRKVACCKV